MAAAPTRDTRRGWPRVAGLGGGRYHCGAAGGGARLRADAAAGLQKTPAAEAGAVHPHLCCMHSRAAKEPASAPRLEPGTPQPSGSPSELRALVAPGPSLRTRSLLKCLPGCLDPSAGSHAAPFPHRRDAPAPARHLPLRGPEGNPPEPSPGIQTMLILVSVMVGDSHAFRIACTLFSLPSS